MVRHPELRIQHRDGADAEYVVPPTIHTIRLTKSDAAPTRITKDRLEIWTSPNNYRYQLAKVPFEFSQSIENSPREVRNLQEKVLTRKGDPVRVLTLSGLNLQGQVHSGNHVFQ